MDELENPTIKLCPFCGGKAVAKRVLRHGFKNDRAHPDAYARFVRCLSCAACGPWRKGSRARAIRDWNDRVGENVTEYRSMNHHIRLLTNGTTHELSLSYAEFHALVALLAAMELGITPQTARTTQARWGRDGFSANTNGSIARALARRGLAELPILGASVIASKHAVVALAQTPELRKKVDELVKRLEREAKKALGER